jgi:hypothetical protein
MAERKGKVPTQVTTPEHYLRRVPREAPPGRIVVHNFVRPAPRLGDRGFRAWTVPEADLAAGRLEVCDCDWPFRWRLTHYRVKESVRRGQAV